MEPKFSWLCPTPRDRERFLDMQDRLEFARRVTIATGALLALTLALTTKAGWVILPALVVMIAVVLVGAWRLESRARPELWIFFSTVVNIQVILAVGSVLSGGPESFLVNTLVLPVVMVGARFSNRGLMIGAPISVVLIIATTAGVDPGYVAAHPESLAIPLSLVLCVVVYMSPLVASDVRHRADSTLDQLTGLLNRRGLERRFAEVAEQAALTQDPVSVVVADIDHFKRINDTHGHPVGDIVLREVAGEMRRSLRTFELLYRMGGEEFLLLLPGANAEDAAGVAETLRDAIEQLHPIGIPVACSFGSATAQGEDVVFAKLLKAADAALYEAKRSGRNRVEQSASAVLVPTPA